MGIKLRQQANNSLHQKEGVTFDPASRHYANHRTRPTDTSMVVTRYTKLGRAIPAAALPLNISCLDRFIINACCLSTLPC